jgi:hypothetical protein
MPEFVPALPRYAVRPYGQGPPMSRPCRAHSGRVCSLSRTGRRRKTMADGQDAREGAPVVLPGVPTRPGWAGLPG